MPRQDGMAVSGVPLSRQSWCRTLAAVTQRHTVLRVVSLILPFAVGCGRSAAGATPSPTDTLLLTSTPILPTVIAEDATEAVEAGGMVEATSFSCAVGALTYNTWRAEHAVTATT